MISATKKTKQSYVESNGEGWGGRYTLFQTDELEKTILKRCHSNLSLVTKVLQRSDRRAS